MRTSCSSIFLRPRGFSSRLMTISYLPCMSDISQAANDYRNASAMQNTPLIRLNLQVSQMLRRFAMLLPAPHVTRHTSHVTHCMGALELVYLRAARGRRVTKLLHLRQNIQGFEASSEASKGNLIFHFSVQFSASRNDLLGLLYLH